MKKIGCLLAVPFMLAALGAAGQSNYKVLKSFHIKSAGGWDYLAVSPVSDRLYVSHGSQVNILDKTTGDSLGVIPHTDGVHGIAFVPACHKGFTSNGKLNTVTVFDIENNAELAQIKTGTSPDAMLYDPFSKKLFICNGHSADLTIVDPATNEVVKTVALGGKPETAVSNETGKIFINIEDKNEVVVLNATTYAVEKRWKTGKGDEPTGLAIDNKTHRLFAGCGNKLLVVLNADNGKVVKELPIGDGCDGVVFDPATKTIFAANGEGTLSIIREKSANSYEVLKKLPTKNGARTLALDEKTHLVYLPTGDFAPAEHTPQESKKKRAIIPGSFQVMVVGQ